MMERKAVKLSNSVEWVGVVDWDIRDFHGYITHRGTTYNAYLVKGNKTALVDAVKSPFAGELLRNISEATDGKGIDVIVANHVEPDHSGSLAAVVKAFPEAPIYCTEKGKKGFIAYYREQGAADWKWNTVKSGDTLELGGPTLHFLEAPMLHWPDSMFTYVAEEKVLLPNDGFGQHYASNGRFDDEVDECELLQEAQAYYANILWPLGNLIQRKLEEVQKLGIEIDVIGPSHGIIWRKDPGKIIGFYSKWAANETEPRAIIAYDTMWGSTEIMAREISRTLSACGIDNRIMHLRRSHPSDIVAEMLTARALVFGAPTLNNLMYPTMARFLEYLKGLKPKNRIAGAFGSYGWGGGAVKEMAGILQEMKLDVCQAMPGAVYRPDEESLAQCRALAEDVARKVAL
jgi:flavorubredoxin